MILLTRNGCGRSTNSALIAPRSRDATESCGRSWELERLPETQALPLNNRQGPAVLGLSRSAIDPQLRAPTAVEKTCFGEKSLGSHYWAIWLRAMDGFGRRMLKRLCAAPVANRAENHANGIAHPIDVADFYRLAGRCTGRRQTRWPAPAMENDSRTEWHGNSR
jgi:hypothetical protein